MADALVEFAETRVGSLLKGKWRLDGVIGVGGMATVYAATHRNGKRVAVKLLHPQFSYDAGIRQRFSREGYVANAVEHQGVVTIDDDDVTEDGFPFLVMELLEGETLEERQAKLGRGLPAAEVLALMDQVLEMLKAAHDKGIVHRDIKPDNLFLTRAGIVKALDFGIAHLQEYSEAGSATQAGAMMGTPHFMAPEQARGRWELVDAQTDLWAVGATMYALLTGRYVHEAATVAEALVMAVTESARPIRELMPNLPTAVAGVVDRALAYEKAQRFAHAAEMQGALRLAAEVLVGNPPPFQTFANARPSSPPGLIEANAQTGRRSLASEGGVEFQSTSSLTDRAMTFDTAPVSEDFSRMLQQRKRGHRLLLAAAAVVMVAGVGAVVHSANELPVAPATQGQSPAAASPEDEAAATRAGANPSSGSGKAGDKAWSKPGASPRPTASTAEHSQDSADLAAPAASAEGSAAETENPSDAVDLTLPDVNIGAEAASVAVRPRPRGSAATAAPRTSNVNPPAKIPITKQADSVPIEHVDLDAEDDGPLSRRH